MLYQVRRAVNELSDTSITVMSIIVLIPPLLLHIHSGLQQINSWQVTEWLISYDGGFVRRGFGGELIKLISSYLHLSPSVIIVSLSTAVWLSLSLLTLRLAKGAVPAYIIFSPLLLGMPVYSEFLVRKDVLGILLLLVALMGIKRFSGFGKYAAINLAIVVAVLNHESFLFYGFPLILFTESMRREWSGYLQLLVLCSPSLFAVVLVLAHTGDQGTAIAITNFWNLYLSEEFSYLCCLQGQPAAIGAIGWTPEQGVSLSLGLFNEFANGFVYVPIAWFLTAVICLQLICWSLPLPQKRLFFVVFALQTLFVLPLFLLGWDFGRWIFFITTSSLLWTLIFKDETLPFCWLSWRLERLDGWLELSTKEAGLLAFAFGVPACCWSLQQVVKSTPIGDNILSMMVLLNSL